jgi:hypothetical protein
MASSIFSSEEAFRRDVFICDDAGPRRCTVLLDPDSWTPENLPLQISGLLELPRSERATLANSERITLKFREDGVPYRLLLDESNGRFLARKM